MNILPREFYLENTVSVAKNLLGKKIVRKIGRVESSILYHKLMEEFEYGNMNGEDVYMDETNLRLVMNIRNNFSRLADQLIAEGDTTKAVNVLNRCIELMPNDKVEYNFFMLPIAENYYVCGQPDKAREVLNTMTQSFDEKLFYYGQFEGDRKNSIRNDIQRTLSLFSSSVKVAYTYDDTEFADELANSFQEKLKNSGLR